MVAETSSSRRVWVRAAAVRIAPNMRVCAYESPPALSQPALQVERKVNMKDQSTGTLNGTGVWCDCCAGRPRDTNAHCLPATMSSRPTMACAGSPSDPPVSYPPYPAGIRPTVVQPGKAPTPAIRHHRKSCRPGTALDHEHSIGNRRPATGPSACSPAGSTTQ
jgi:hypothetical protein